MAEKLSVRFYDEDGVVAGKIRDVDYVSFVNDDTYGPPPLVAPSAGSRPLAKPGDRVLYINTRFNPVFEIERYDDADE